VLPPPRGSSAASWFRHNGLQISIFSEGFGESSALVKTGDNVDEPRNRRVDYILAVEPPTVKAKGHRPSWNQH